MSGGAVWQAFIATSNAVASATHHHLGHCDTCIDCAQLLHVLNNALHMCAVLMPPVLRPAHDSFCNQLPGHAYVFSGCNLTALHHLGEAAKCFATSSGTMQVHRAAHEP